MKERPILMKAPMVLALLAGTKTQTRRLVKKVEQMPFRTRPIDEHPWETLPAIKEPDGGWTALEGVPVNWEMCPYGVSGDRLWVRERMRVSAIDYGAGAADRAEKISVTYEADGSMSGYLPYPERLAGTPVIGKCLAYGGYREASRITLELTETRVERVQSISADDVVAEGISPSSVPGLGSDASLVEAYRKLWESINGADSWREDPWVWVLSFNVLERDGSL